jgi:hypothetical protein
MSASSPSALEHWSTSALSLALSAALSLGLTSPVAAISFSVLSRVTLRVILFAACLGAALPAPGCAGAARRPRGQTLSIYVTRFGDSLLFATRAAVTARKAVNPSLWLVWGEVFGDRVRTALSDGEWQVRLLDRAGVDAVAAGPEWLGFGAARARRLADASRFYVLCANVADSTGQTFGHALMTKRLSEATVGFACLSLDTGDILLRLGDVRMTPAALAARRAEALAGQRCDVVVLAFASAESVRLQVAGGVIPIPEPVAGRVARVDLNLASGAVAGFRVEEEDVTPYLSDSSVKVLSDSAYRSWSALPDPQAPLPKPQLNAARSQSALVGALLKTGEMDGFIADSALFRAGLEGGLSAISQSGLADRMSEPGRFARLSFAGSELAGLPGLMLRPGLGLSKVNRTRMYIVGTTLGFLRRHPQLAARGFSLSERPLWTTCFGLLESRAIK